MPDADSSIAPPGEEPPPVGESLVQQVLLCDVFQRAHAGYRGESTSRPGHLLQLMRTGRTDHEVGGRQYRLGPGHLIWYHEDEWVRIRVREAPWSFYTLNFIAPALEPPPFEQRVGVMGSAVQRRFDGLLRVWRDTSASPTLRHLRVHAQLARLLGEVIGRLRTHHGEAFAMNAAAKLWWELEGRLRQDLAAPIDLPTMVRWSGRSRATIARACHAAVGMSPMKRVKRIRLSLARGLVTHSGLSITEIAERVGYGRLHEFSRDYRRHFGRSPREQRRGGND